MNLASGIWTDPNNWDLHRVPTDTDDAVIARVVTVTVSSPSTPFRSLTVAGGGNVNLPNGLTLNGNTVNLGDMSGSRGTLTFIGTQMLDGTGSVMFQGPNFTGNALNVTGSAGSMLTIGPNVTVHGGWGSIGNSGYTLVNQGTISDDVNHGTITLNGSNWTNAGTLQAINGGTIATTPIGGPADFSNIWTNTSRISAVGSSTFASTLRLYGTWTNAATGTITASGATCQVTLGFGGASDTTTGSNLGTITASDGSVMSLFNNWTSSGPITATDATLRFCNDPLHTWSNRNTVTATNSDVYLYGVFTLADLGTFDRTGGRVLLGGTLNNAGTTLALNATTGSWILATGTINDGTVTEADGAELNFISAGGTLRRVTFNGDIDLATFGDPRVTIAEGLTLNGTARLGDNTGGFGFEGFLVFQGTQTLDGTGTTVLFGASVRNSLSVTGAAGSTLTLSQNVALRGKNGTIGSTGFAIDNQGTIAADASGGTLNLQGTWTNHGTFGASNGATLTLKNTGTWSTANPLTATPNATVNVNGTLTTTSGSTLTLAGGGSFRVASGGVVTTTDGLTLDHSTLTLGADDGSTPGTLTFQGTQTLGGTGTVVFGGSSANSLAITGAAGSTLTIAPNLTLRGANGTIGSAGFAFDNQGTIAADVLGGTLNLQGTWTNDGTVQAANRGTLNASSPTNYAIIAVLHGGTWQAFANSTLRVALSVGIAFNEANILLDAGANFYSDSGTTDALQTTFIDNTYLGSFTVQNGREFITLGAFQNDGALNVGPGGRFAVSGVLLNFVNNTLTGGSYVIGGTFEFTNAAIVTNAASIYLYGMHGQIIDQNGNDALAGTFATNATSGYFRVENGLNFTTPGDFENDGTLAVSAGGTFTVRGVDTDRGTLTVSDRGTLNLAGGGTASGTVSNLGTLAVATGTTFAVTGTLSNFAGNTLSGGTYAINGIFQFANAAIVTNAASIVLDGPGAQITDLLGNDALAGTFATNAAAGRFTLLDGAAFITAGNFTNLGSLTVGLGSTFGVSGNFTQGAAGTLDLQLDGTSAGQFGTLAVTGTATLAGTLQDTLVNGYGPMPGDAFPILTYGARSGDFATGPAGFTRSFDDGNGILTLTAQ
jgi:hypothetical protein